MNLRELDDRWLPAAARALQRGLARLPRPRRTPGPARASGPSRPSSPGGPSGPSGPSGSPGLAGPSGPSGLAGLSSPGGPSGPAGPAGPAPFVLRLRRLDDRWAGRGPFGLLRDVPQLGALLLALVVLVGGATVAQRATRPDQPDPGSPPPDAGQVLIGPTFGESVAAYVADARARFEQLALGQPDGPAYGVVSFDRYRTVAEARALLGVPGVTLVQVFVRVPPPPPQQPIVPVVADSLDDVPGRLAEMAAGLEAEAANLRREAATIDNDPDQKKFNEDTARANVAAAAKLQGNCRCLFGAVVRGKLRQLAGLAPPAPGCRLLDAAPAGTEPAGVTYRPLLPEERVTVTEGNEEPG